MLVIELFIARFIRSLPLFSIRQQTKPLPTNISRSRFGGGPGMGGAAGFERDGIPQKIFERCGRSSF